MTEMQIKDIEPQAPDGRMSMCKARNIEDEEYTESFVTFDSKEDAQEMGVGTTVRCLDIMRDKQGENSSRFISGLVLRRVDGREGLHKRIGFSTMKIEDFNGCEKEVVTIL